jgi:hypothetical protein
MTCINLDNSLLHKSISSETPFFRYWYGPWEFGQLGMRSSLKDALGIAVAYHALMRNGKSDYLSE